MKLVVKLPEGLFVPTGKTSEGSGNLSIPGSVVTLLSERFGDSWIVHVPAMFSGNTLNTNARVIGALVPRTFAHHARSGVVSWDGPWEDHDPEKGQGWRSGSSGSIEAVLDTETLTSFGLGNVSEVAALQSEGWYTRVLVSGALPRNSGSFASVPASYVLANYPVRANSSTFADECSLAARDFWQAQWAHLQYVGGGRGANRQGAYNIAPSYEEMRSHDAGRIDGFLASCAQVLARGAGVVGTPTGLTTFAPDKVTDGFFLLVSSEDKPIFRKA